MKTTTPAWQWSKPAEAELLYLSLAVQHHCGQQQPLTSCGIETNEGSSDDAASLEDDNDIGDLEQADRTHNVDTRMKQRFLDNFSELLACRKDPRFVSCSSLVECATKAKVFVARNGGFDIDGAGSRSTDSKFFKEFERQTRGISKGTALTECAHIAQDC